MAVHFIPEIAAGGANELKNLLQETLLAAIFPMRDVLLRWVPWNTAAAGILNSFCRRPRSEVVHGAAALNGVAAFFSSQHSAKPFTAKDAKEAKAVFGI